MAAKQLQQVTHQAKQIKREGSGERGKGVVLLRSLGCQTFDTDKDMQNKADKQFNGFAFTCSKGNVTYTQCGRVSVVDLPE